MIDEGIFSGATVLLNGIEKGTTPVTIENISPGEQQVSLKKLGYQTINERIVLNTGQTSDIQFELLETNIPKIGHDFDVITRSSVMRMIFVRPGSFQMGSSKGSPAERPVHEVELSEGFWLGETEVTQMQWADIMGLNPAQFKHDNQPVENVSWTDAIAFCEKVNSIERKRGFLPAGYKFTLPTEAQWEYACRSGSRAIETTSLESLAWYKKNTNGKPNPVAQRDHNQWGFYDMHGNIWEWCLDKYDSEYYSVSPTKDPQGSKYGSSRVIRGGGWNFDIWHCRSTVRRGISPDNRMNYVGFRLALVPISE